MVWLYLVTYSHGPLEVNTYATGHNISTFGSPIGNLWHELFEDYYPMTLAMIAGSMIAGSTPLGGGVVAFPVAVLVIGFTPAEGRDFTVLIQSIGMNAAAYLIIMDKGELLDFTLITIFILFGIPGVLIGLAFPVVPFYAMSLFQMLVLTFAFVFHNQHDPFPPTRSSPTSMILSDQHDPFPPA